MKRLLFLCFATFAMHAATTGNDTSCDISVTPAATLLLPYFEVDLAAAGGETTLFTITNTAALPQAVQITLWTDYDLPVIAFNVYLTGYDVQSINLYDVIANGRIAAGGYDVSPIGELSHGDNRRLREGSCNNLPEVIPAPALARMRAAFTTGKLDACNTAGSAHKNAIGYATIDVVGACNPRLPTDSTYYRDLIRFDNVLIGDYLQLNGRENHAQGSPLVHIGAIPEGGMGRSREGKPKFTVNAPRTFYSRFQHPSTPKLDARQPLPAVFAARWTDGTFYKIWRERSAPRDTACSALRERAPAATREIVFFDEEENPEVVLYRTGVVPPTYTPTLPSTSLTDFADFWPWWSNAGAGWMYLNLDDHHDPHATQNWVVASLRTAGRSAIDVDAAALGNGCSAAVPISEVGGYGDPIGPLPNVPP